MSKRAGSKLDNEARGSGSAWITLKWIKRSPRGRPGLTRCGMPLPPVCAAELAQVAVHTVPGQYPRCGEKTHAETQIQPDVNFGHDSRAGILGT